MKFFTFFTILMILSTVVIVKENLAVSCKDSELDKYQKDDGNTITELFTVCHSEK